MVCTQNKPKTHEMVKKYQTTFLKKDDNNTRKEKTKRIKKAQSTKSKKTHNMRTGKNVIVPVFYYTKT